MWKIYFGLLLPVGLSFLIGAAHFWRAGMYGLSASLVGFIFLAVSTHSSWVRLVMQASLMLLSARWVWVCGGLVQLRLQLGEPWIRLACILLGVATFTLLSAWLMQRPKAKAYYSQHSLTGKYSATVFLLVFLVFVLIDNIAPRVLLLHRFLPNFGLLQGFFLSVWATYVLRKLMEPTTKILTRMKIWRIFSCVFFGQLFLSILGYSIFLMTDKLHLPIPGIILAAPIFRGEGYFMLILFSISIFLVGGAWCSHLCYFGVWDNYVAFKKRSKKTRSLPPYIIKYMPYSAPLCLILTIILAAGLRYFSVPTFVAINLGLLLGLLLFPAMAFVSYRYGITGYCLAICPLGVLATRLRALTPWRIRFTQDCTHCQKCVHVCTSMALDLNAIQRKKPYTTCTLCGNCTAVCKHNGCIIDCAWWSLKPEQSQAIFCVLIVAMHSIFLGVAMI